VRYARHVLTRELARWSINSTWGLALEGLGAVEYCITDTKK